MIKKILEHNLQVLWELMPDDVARGGNETFYATQVEPHIRNTITRFHIQQLEEEIEELEGMELKEYDGLDRLVHKNIGYNTALQDLITIKQQQIQEAKELLDNGN